MKKILLALLVIGIGIASNAQFTKTIPLAAGDTAVDTGTASKVIRTTTGASGVAVHCKVVKIDGTVAGTVGIYGSGDGTTYDLITTAFTATNVATQQKTFYITAPVPEYLKVIETGAGTMRAILTVKYRTTLYQNP